MGQRYTPSPISSIDIILDERFRHNHRVIPAHPFFRYPPGFLYAEKETAIPYYPKKPIVWELYQLFLSNLIWIFLLTNHEI